MEKKIKIIAEDKENKRLDQYLHNYFTTTCDKEISRAIVQEYIPTGVYINGRTADCAYRVKTGDEIECNMPKLLSIIKEKKAVLTQKYTIVPQGGDIDIVYECDDYLVINKPHGLLVHPSKHNLQGTLANYVAGYMTKKGLEIPPMAGIVHRLDREVGGLIIVAKNKTSYSSLRTMFKTHKVLKVYKANIRHQKGSIYNSMPFGKWIMLKGFICRDKISRKRRVFATSTRSSSDKEAVSYLYKINDKSCYIRIETGRNHQIRATLKSLGAVIVGDVLYGYKGKVRGYSDAQSKIVEDRAKYVIQLESVLIQLEGGMRYLLGESDISPLLRL